MKLETIIENQNEGLRMLRQLATVTRGVGGSDTCMLEDVLPEPINEVLAFNELCEKLADDEFRKKMVIFLDITISALVVSYVYTLRFVVSDSYSGVLKLVLAP
jgi:hypothetical protein